MKKSIILLTALFLTACASPDVDRTTSNFSETKFDNDLSECQGGNIVTASAKTVGVAMVGSAVGAFHGMDDSFYRHHYDAEQWALPGAVHDAGHQTDRELVVGGPMPFSTC